MDIQASHKELTEKLETSISDFNTIVSRINTLEEENRRLKQELAGARQKQLGNAQKITTSQKLELAELIIEKSPAILFRRLAADDPKERKMVYVSPNISRFGYNAEDFLHNRIMFRQILFPGDRERILIEIQHFVKNNIENYSQYYRIVTKSGEIRWVEDQTSIIEDPATGIRYHQGIVIDIHERKEAEEKLRKNEEKYRRIVETAGEGFLLMDKSLAIVDLNSAFARIVGSSRDELIGQKPFAEYTDEFCQFWTTDPGSTTPNQYHEFECQLKTSDQRKVPVLIHANTLCSDSGEIIGNMAFVTDLTAQKKALSLAGEVQRSLLPEKAPTIYGLDIAGKNIPCEEVGGDYFDYIYNEEDTADAFTVVVGDITGHGVDSALLMSSARAFLRMRASQPGSITDIVMDMNKHMTEDVHSSGRFMTLFYLTVEEKRRSLSWIRAGHDPALFYDPAQDKFEELKGPGLVLGVGQDFSYQLQRKDGLKKNQLIVIGTDGIWEGCNKEGQMFGKERLKDVVRRNASSNAGTILDAVFKEHAGFTQGVRQEDDLTLVVVKFV